MSEIKLFKLGETTEEINNVETSFDLNLPSLIEKNSKLFFGVTFVATDFICGGAMIPTVGLDENRCPVVFVYSKDSKMNFLSKGLFFLDQLVSAKEKFTIATSNKLGKKAAEAIDWSLPRIIILSSGFNKYDRSAVYQLSRNVSLIQYNQYGDNMIMFELIASNAGMPTEEAIKAKGSFQAAYKKANGELKAMFDSLCEYVEFFGECVTINATRNYVAFKKIKNFGCARIDDKKIIVNLNLDPAKFVGVYAKCKDVTFAPKLGTGHVQFVIENNEDYEIAKNLLLEAYNRN